MANIYGANYTTRNPVTAGAAAGTIPDVIESGEWGGRVRVAYDSYTASGGATGASDVIYMGQLPANATFLYGVIETDNTNGTATYKVDVGSTEVKVTSGGTLTANVPAIFGKNAAGTKTTALTDVKVTLGTAALASGKIIKLMIFYTVD